MAATGGGGPLYTNPRLRAELMEVLAERQRESRFTTATVPNSLPDKYANLSSSVERARMAADAATKAVATGKVPTRTATTGSGAAGVTTTSRTTRTATPAPDVKISAQAYTASGFYYDVDLDFALGPLSGSPSPAYTTEEKNDWGRNWSKDLVNPKKNCLYLVRTKITQMRNDPLIGGFTVRFVMATGWTLVDGKSLTLDVEVTSNPLVIIRKVRSPSTIKNAAFAMKVLKIYP